MQSKLLKNILTKTFQNFKDKKIKNEFEDLVINVIISQYKFYVGRFIVCLKTTDSLE